MKKINILIAAIGITVAVTGFSVYKTVYAAFPYSVTKTMVTDATILAADINTSNSDHINNNIPESIDDYSANATEMQSVRDPYPETSISLSSTLDDEIQGLRHVLQAITQETYWYIDPPTFCENSANYDHGTYNFTTGGQITFDVDGTAIGAAGALNFGTDTASFWSDGTDLVGTSTNGIKLNLGSGSNDDFTIGTTKLAVGGDDGHVGIGIATPPALFSITQAVDTSEGGMSIGGLLGANDRMQIFIDSNDDLKFRDASSGEVPMILTDAGDIQSVGILSHANEDITMGVGASTVAITTTFVTLTGDGGGNTINTITGGETGQHLTILWVDLNVAITDTDAHGANTVDLKEAFISADDTVLELLYDGTSWYEVSRSVN